MKVLIAEDQAIDRRIIKTMLMRLGYDVTEAVDGSEAWDIIQDSEGIQIVVLDWMMPELDGLEVCRRIRYWRPVDAPYIYVILLTSRETKEDVAQGFDAGADDYIIKPVDAEELRMRLLVAQRTVKLQDRLHFWTTRDAVTGLFNRQTLLARMASETVECGDHQTAVALIDVDHFKEINEEHGHEVGDVVLREIASRIRRVLKPADLVGRFGGEEFLAVIHDVNAQSLWDVGREIRSLISGISVKAGEKEIQVTVAVGMALAEPGLVMDQLVRRADEAMYLAKQTGRNNARIYGVDQM